MSLLEQDTTRKGRVHEAEELDAGDDSGEYEVEAIRDSAVYARESESGHLPGLYYLVSWKGYPEEENTWEPASAVKHLRKLISSFHKDHPDKPMATSLQSTLHHQWLDQSSLSSGKEDNQQDALRSAPRRANRRVKRGEKEEAIRKRRQGGIRVSVVLRAKSRRVAGDLFP